VVHSAWPVHLWAGPEGRAENAGEQLGINVIRHGVEWHGMECNADSKAYDLFKVIITPSVLNF
jgi:hypothetical protein